MLELDFLKCHDRTSDFYHQMRFLGSNAQTPLGELAVLDLRGPLRLLSAYKSASLL